MIVARISLLRHYFFDQSGRGFPEAIHEQTQPSMVKDYSNILYG